MSQKPVPPPWDPDSNITMVFSFRWHQPDLKRPPMGGCLVARLPHLCWRGGPGCHPLLLLPQGDAQGETRTSLSAKGLGGLRLTCQQSKCPPYPHPSPGSSPHPLVLLCNLKLHPSLALHFTTCKYIPIQAPQHPRTAPRSEYVWPLPQLKTSGARGGSDSSSQGHKASEGIAGMRTPISLIPCPLSKHRTF